MRENERAAGGNGGKSEGSDNNPQSSCHSSTYGAHLLPQHQALLAPSAIVPAVAEARGYRSIETKADLERKGFSRAQRNVPGLLIPVYSIFGECATYQYRPDEPRVNKEGKIIKYETPTGSRLVLDVPPPARAWLGDPKRRLFVTEGARKADAAVSVGLCCVALLGVWSWRGTNEHGGKTALADWEGIALDGREVCIAFDSDAMQKREVNAALARLRAFLEQRGASVQLIYLPAGDGAAKVGLDDYLAAGHGVNDLLALAARELAPLRDRESEAADREAAQTYDLARPLLEAPDLLERVASAIRTGGYAGDERPPMLVYLALTSRLLERPCNLALIAPSAAGKNYAVDAARALIYSDADLQHRAVIFAEADSILEDGPAASAIRSLATDNEMIYDVVESDEESGRHYTRRVEKPGPTGLITTSTKRLREQLSTRMLTVGVPDTPDHVRAVLLAHAQVVNGVEAQVDVAPFQAMQRWLELVGERRVTIPYARDLAGKVPADLVRMNRDFRQLLTMIQAVALLYQRQRQRDQQGRIVATMEDYQMVRDRLLEVFTATATGGVTPSVRATVEAVRSLYDSQHPVTVTRVADHLHLPKNTTLYRVRAARTGGYIVNEETKRGQPAKLVPGDPLPEERAALPEPSQLSVSAPEHPETSRTVESAPSARSYGESGGAVQLPIEPALNRAHEAERFNLGSMAFQTPIEPATSPVSDTKMGPSSGAVQRFNGDRGDMRAHTPICPHRPPGEADALWEPGEATWGDDAAACSCCGGPARGELVDVDGRCPTCRADQPAPERGGHLVRQALDLGGQLVSPAAS